MTEGTVRKIVTLAALTGMRSMAGLATIASRNRSVWRPVIALAAAGEMIADKTSLVGNRTDPVPLAGRTVFGAVVGAVIAAEQERDLLLGAVLGAVTAFAAAHLAYQVRTRLPLPGVVGGLVEDGLVVAIGSRYA